MTTAIFLLLAALIMIYLEFFLPGGVMGTAGGLLLLLSIIIATQASESLAFAVIFTIVALVALGATVKLALWQIRSSGKYKTIYLDDDQEGFKAPTYDASAIGKQGTTSSVMAPSGYVKIEGKKYQAVSKTGFIQPKTPVEVVGGKGAYLVVKEIKNTSKKEETS